MRGVTCRQITVSRGSPRGSGSSEAALRAVEKTEDLGALAGAHNLLGVLSEQDLSKAREHLEQALQCARTLRDADIEIAAADNLAQVHAAAGSLERALPVAESALARAGQMGDRHREATLRNTLRTCCVRRGAMPRPWSISSVRWRCSPRSVNPASSRRRRGGSRPGDLRSGAAWATPAIRWGRSRR